MSYSMSPPAQKPSPYPPYQTAASPPAQTPYGAPPPAKRQRLSPDARSPNGNANYASSPHGLPNTAYGNPYAAQGVQSPYSPSSFAGSPQNSFNTPQPYQQQHMPWPVQSLPQQQQQQQQRSSQMSPPLQQTNRDMPPPPRPNKEDEKAGIDEIGDSLFGSGINLKDEESYLHNMWNRPTDSFATNQSTSFGSGTMGSNGSFNMLTQATSFGSQGQDGPFAGTLGQLRSQEDVENEVRRKREAAARRLAEDKQHALKAQFLEGNCLRNRMDRLAKEGTVRLDVHGVYLRNAETQQQSKIMMNEEANEGIVAAGARPESMIEAGVPYEHILSLICLAANERLRGLVDEAFGLARARKYGDHGRVVPPEFSDIAAGDGQKTQDRVIPESITGTSWDKSQDTLLNGINGDSHSDGAKDTPQPIETVSFQSALHKRLRDLAERDRQLEDERIKKREARKKNQADGATGDDGIPGTPAEVLTPAEPIAAAAPVKMTKKEMNKKQKEAQAANNENVNQTAALAMGLGGKTKKYSWMTGGATNVPTNRYAKNPTGSGTATPKAQANAPAAKAATTKEVKAPTWGDWREDSVDGKGIQLRDWISVLDRDGREKKALERAMSKLK